MKQTLNDFFYLFLGLIALCCSISGCDDSIDVPMTPVDEHEQVPVLLSLDFSAEADGYTPVPGSRSGLPFRARLEGGNAPFEASLCPSVSTRSDLSDTPDALYYLEAVSYTHLFQVHGIWQIFQHICADW